MAASAAAAEAAKGQVAYEGTLDGSVIFGQLCTGCHTAGVNHAPKLVKLDQGNHPKWSPSAVYHGGDRVTFEGLPYQARWYTQGEQPLAELPSDPSASWEPLFKYPGEPNSAGAESK